MHKLGERFRFGIQMLEALARTGSTTEKNENLTGRLALREANFLDLVETRVVKPDRHPYDALLDASGWNFARIRREVGSQGLETTLGRLAADGVYLTADEIKGRQPLVRNGRQIPFSPTDLDFVNGPAVPLGTSGTSGPRTKNPIDPDGFRLLALHLPAMFDALQAWELPLALYYPAISSSGIGHLLCFALAGKPADAWFCHMSGSSEHWSRWRFWLRGLTGAARLRGLRLAAPRLAPIERPESLTRWLASCSGGAVVATYPGSALRVDAWAKKTGTHLPPLVWILGGEPVSKAKRMLLEQSGHRVYPWYGAIDIGRIAIGCLNPEGADDMHLLSDRFAAIGSPHDAKSHDKQLRRLLLTSLVPEVHKLLLNVETGDHVELVERHCGCPLETLGLNHHVRGVRSVEKLTLEGITLPTDLVRELAEDVLPRVCGGTLTDFQLAEEEDDRGFTKLVTLVDPKVPVEDDLVLEAVRTFLRRAAGGAGHMVRQIEKSDSLSIRRETPVTGPGGKQRLLLRTGGGFK